MQLDEAARQFCRWYDEYQTDYARAKLRAELRHNAGLPPEEFPGKSTMRCFERMIESYEALHIAATGEPRPNYVERAKGPTVRTTSLEGTDLGR